MKNGPWTPMHFARFSAVRQYDNHRLFSKENGLDPRDMVSRTEFVRLLMESGTVDPFQFTQNFIKKQTEEARKKQHRQLEKEGYHELDLNDPNVRADIEETRRRVFAYRDKLGKKEKEKAKANLQEKEKRRSRE
nr:hypothetical protein [Tanacetum cinerariifolium]